jgi:phenylacetate-CoA ligase
MVVTTLCKEAAPLIRYRTRDLTRLVDRPCSCGSLLPMHDRILGRSDDMIIFRGVNIYPGQIDQVLSSIPEAGCEFQVVLERLEDGKDHMTIRLECCEGFDPAGRPGLAQAVAGRFKQRIQVSPRVEIVDACSLPRSERKAKRIFDHRPL